MATSGQGQTTVNFGNYPGTSDASLAITGQTGILAGALVEAWVLPQATADHSADEHIAQPLRCLVTSIVANTGFTLRIINDDDVDAAEAPPGAAIGGTAGGMGFANPVTNNNATYGQWTIAWAWNNLSAGTLGSITQGLKNRWAFSEGAGTTVADSISGNTINLVNSVTWTTGPPTIGGNAAVFDGISMYGVTSGNMAIGANICTLSFWLWWDTFANNDSLAMEQAPPLGTGSFAVDPNAATIGFSGLFGSFFFGLGATAASQGFTRPSAAAWHHYAVVFDNSNGGLTHYLDGAVVLTSQLTTGLHTWTGPQNFPSNVLYLMSRTGASLFAAGRMADLRVYNRALSPAEVASIAAGTG